MHDLDHPILVSAKNTDTSNHTFTSVHSGKASRFDGMSYSQWHHMMKVHLMSLNPSIWKVVCIGVDFPEKGETPNYN
jgi:hypothetical protein